MVKVIIHPKEVKKVIIHPKGSKPREAPLPSGFGEWHSPEPPAFANVELFRKYGKPAPEREIPQPKLTNAKRYAELGNHIMAHHTLRQSFERGELHPETFHKLAVEMFEKEHGKEAAPELLNIANAAYEGRFSNADIHTPLGQLLENGKITKAQHDLLLQNIQLQEGQGAQHHASKHQVISNERAESIIRANIDGLYSLKNATPEEKIKVKKQLHEEYMRGEGGLHQLVTESSDQLRDKQASGFSYRLVGTENAVLEREASRILNNLRKNR